MLCHENITTSTEDGEKLVNQYSCIIKEFIKKHGDLYKSVIKEDVGLSFLIENSSYTKLIIETPLIKNFVNFVNKDESLKENDAIKEINSKMEVFLPVYMLESFGSIEGFSYIDYCSVSLIVVYPEDYVCGYEREIITELMEIFALMENLLKEVNVVE